MSKYGCRACGTIWDESETYDDPLNTWNHHTCGNLGCGAICDEVSQQMPYRCFNCREGCKAWITRTLNRLHHKWDIGEELKGLCLQSSQKCTCGCMIPVKGKEFENEHNDGRYYNAV